MVNGDFSIKKLYNSFIQRNGAGSSSRSQRIHDYSKSIFGQDYVLESAVEAKGFYITAQGYGIKPQDYILLSDGGSKTLYQISKVEYYSEPSDMWIALIFDTEARG